MRNAITKRTMIFLQRKLRSKEYGRFCQGLASILPYILDLQCPFQQFLSLRFFPTAGFIVRTFAVDWRLFSTKKVTISTHFVYVYEIRQWLICVILQTCTVPLMTHAVGWSSIFYFWKLTSVITVLDAGCQFSNTSFQFGDISL